MSRVIDVYTDGAASGNGTSKARGGWAFIYADEDGTEISSYGGERNTTNNRMELTAAIKAIEVTAALCVEDTRINIISDSAYLINCKDQGWYKNWVANGWINSSKKPVANKDLWEILIPYFDNENYIFSKCAGHSGVEYNEKVDKLAKKGAQEVK